VIVLTGAGRHFSAGNDLDEFESMTPENGQDRMFQVREAFFAIQSCVVPVIGAVAGVALGTGLALAASCDFVVASDDAQFGLPELSVGVMGGAKHLARLVPEPIVRWMFFTGERVSAEKLAGWGGVVSVVPRESVIAEARKVAARVASYSPTAVRVGKDVLDRIENCDVRQGYELEQRATVRMSGHPDSKAALQASRLGTPVSFEPLR
jgi:enoyl-CoA hydratase/carnithine racemase